MTAPSQRRPRQRRSSAPRPPRPAGQRRARRRSRPPTTSSSSSSRAPRRTFGLGPAQIGPVDEAFALLSDPTIDRSALGDVHRAVAAPPPRDRSRPRRGPLATTSDRELEAGASTAEPREGSATAPAAPGPVATRRPLIGPLGAIVVGVVAVAVAGFNLNGGTGVPAINGTPAPEAAASPGDRHRPGRRR